MCYILFFKWVCLCIMLPLIKLDFPLIYGEYAVKTPVTCWTTSIYIFGHAVNMDSNNKMVVVAKANKVRKPLKLYVTRLILTQSGPKLPNKRSFLATHNVKHKFHNFFGVKMVGYSVWMTRLFCFFFIILYNTLNGWINWILRGTFVL